MSTSACDKSREDRLSTSIMPSGGRNAASVNRRDVSSAYLLLGAFCLLMMVSGTALVRHNWIARTSASGANSVMRLVTMESARCGETRDCSSTIAELALQVTDAGFAIPEDKISLELKF